MITCLSKKSNKVAAPKYKPADSKNLEKIMAGLNQRWIVNSFRILNPISAGILFYFHWKADYFKMSVCMHIIKICKSSIGNVHCSQRDDTLSFSAILNVKHCRKIIPVFIFIFIKFISYWKHIAKIYTIRYKNVTWAPTYNSPYLHVVANIAYYRT